jgi:broad specificity phosphatase PhoE
MSKRLIFVRHAHRDTTVRQLDNGLTDKGREQAKSIKRYFLSRFGEDEVKDSLWLVSSPKIRCVETLLPLSRSTGRAVDIHPSLNEGEAGEGSRMMEARIQNFLTEWKQSKVEITVACSHGDWLPIAFHQLLGLHLEPKKGSWLEIEWELDRPELVSYIPSFKHFYSS